jgi:hypothetical protein
MSLRYAWLICAGFGCVITAAHAAVITVALPIPLDITTELFLDSFPVDIDQNASKDFIFFGSISGASVQPLRYNRVAIEVDPPPDLAGVLTAFPPGALIGADIAQPLAFFSADFTGDQFVEEGEFLSIQIVQCFDLCSYTPFAAGRGYAGFEFERNGLKHYGYFDLSGAPNAKGVALYGWAWETEPGRAITAGAIPEPSTAAYMGGSAFLLWQRNAHTRKQNKALQRTARGLFVSTLHLIRKCLGFGGAHPRP